MPKKQRRSAQADKLSVAERLKRRSEGAAQRTAMKQKLADQKERAKKRAASRKSTSGDGGMRKKYGGLVGRKNR